MDKEVQTRHEVLYDILDRYASLPRAEMKKELERLVAAVKQEAIKNVRDCMGYIERI